MQAERGSSVALKLVIVRDLSPNVELWTSRRVSVHSINQGIVQDLLGSSSYSAVQAGTGDPTTMKPVISVGIR